MTVVYWESNAKNKLEKGFKKKKYGNLGEN